MHAVDEVEEALFLFRQVAKEPSILQFLRSAANMIAVRDGDMPGDDDHPLGEADWCEGIPLTDIRCKVVRDAAFARRVVKMILAAIDEQIRRVIAEKREVTNARP